MGKRARASPTTNSATERLATDNFLFGSPKIRNVSEPTFQQRPPTPQPQQQPAAKPQGPIVGPVVPPAPWQLGPTIQPGAKPLGPVSPYLNPYAGMYGGGAMKNPLGPVAPTATQTPAPSGATTVAPAPGQVPGQTTGQTPGQTTAVDPNAKPPVNPAAPPKQPDPKEISQLAADIRKETDGHWFANPASTLQLLRGRTPEEIAAIKAEYKSHYGTDLDQSLGSSLGGKDKAEYQALMTQDSKDPASRAKAAIAGLQNAEKDNFMGIGGQHADKAAVEKIIKGLDATSRAELQKQGFDLDGYLQKYYSGDELTKVKAQGSGDKAAEMAADLKMATHTGWFGASTDNTKILDTLAQCKTEEERKAVADAYKQISNGQDLTAMVGDKLKNEDQKAAQALLDGKPDVAAAYQIEAASKPQGMLSFIGIGGPDKDRLNKQFEGKTPEECKAIRDAYNATMAPPDKKNDPNYNALDSKLNTTLSGDDLLKAQQMSQTGKMSDELAIKMAMNTGLFGMFTDDKKVNSVLEGKTKAEIDELTKKYSDLTGGADMVKDLTSRTGGDAGFEVQMSLKGKPETPEAMVEQANERYQHQRGNGIRNFFVDTFGGEAGKDLDRQNQRLNTSYNKAKEGDGKVDGAEFAEINQLADWNKIDAKSLQERTDSIANAAGTVASVTAGVALTIATAGAASPVLAAALVAGGSGAAMMTTKALVKGGGYGGDELKGDLVDTGFSMAGGMATAGIGQLMQGAKMDGFLRNVLKIDPTKAAAELSAIEKMKMSILSKGIEGGLGGVSSAATSRKNWEGGAGDFFGNMAKDGLMGFGKGAFGGLMGSLPGTLADKDFAAAHPGMAWMQKIPGFGDPSKKDQDFGMGQSLLNGLIGGGGKAAKNYALETVTETLKDGNTWSGGNIWNSLLQHGEDNLNEGKWAKDVAGGVKDGVMSNRLVENKLRSLVGADQVAPGAKPSTWGDNLTEMSDRYKVSGLKNSVGGMFGGLIDSTVDVMTPGKDGVQNQGMMFLNNILTGGLKGIQSGVESVDSDKRGDDAKKARELQRDQARAAANPAPTTTPAATETAPAATETAPAATVPATTEPAATETAPAATIQAPANEVFPNAPAGMTDQDVFEYLSH